MRVVQHISGCDNGAEMPIALSRSGGGLEVCELFVACQNMAGTPDRNPGDFPNTPDDATEGEQALLLYASFGGEVAGLELASYFVGSRLTTS
ncbi:hypothetical protein N7499_000234 [Penicillium canescens]|uniref:Uncharacterized protein n=1 Tax=Penicillium canescens TaxID=5083 RepID=A0AAD6NAZ7_PENCN|nr:uncharacterized protein N7446_011566 [Penicillium canescens]KAJ6004164.1 hypothetical protein N7522_005809 [Penicillium canescens]KAJ6029090.1 hypothetical protein N7444_012077 [Penicillium canescens]KAJ6047522.1 hypothetical protein N7460_003669 [Penicillium canescens]KAJ6048883.1 hypothetical protein N7446_011566 [Penicillium canescens]KAJ6100604.1 hypothetical protein N7499_000234 [Penicillium canescens]